MQSGYKELEEAIKKEEEREHHFTTLSKEITNLTLGISKNNTRISGCQRQIRDLESEIQTITDKLANRNTEHEKLTEFKENLEKTIEDLSTRKEEILQSFSSSIFVTRSDLMIAVFSEATV